ncbi:subclass B1 metallo-beta-lactamase [uncultured Kordia sp.]|uniref:subclass B1 metallo-beta-lactamase n=1 Tax=uncultured Kordia sp. TaxID=507699 RepID=UPI00260368C0|nr:subclass B1 metallo-beta-lactamase [uncultured Kordia sp.]
MKPYSVLIILFLFFSCKPAKKGNTNYASETLKIQQISPNVFMHISYLQTNDFGNVPCNGMIYFNKNEAIVFDTPTNDAVSKELIDWIENEQKKIVKAVVVTHFHVDCLGGLQQFHNNGTPSYAHYATIELVQQDPKKVMPKHGFNNSFELTIGEETVILQFFGEGHTSDNIVGYIPSEKALFGGCLIKSLKAGKGNLEDANVNAWSATVENIKKEIPTLNIVIPGHGKYGNAELLDYTIQLFK